ncbi:Extracellular superoxide dismutase [Cu-Zn] [Myotis brandtii]|uniref:Extracellular superoxide dismutase [Cu-Zn] n=1 Tax=Myotis brandtii TaxID=109478 RepID=S7PUY4_MYOBR|nr:Extracellular superoxide dismutase [Cu-Zn] [Myotis brandtii]
MLALLCACWFLVAWASGASVGFDASLGGPEEPNRDLRAIVTETGEEMARRRREATMLYAACHVQPSASLDTTDPQVTGLVLFRQLAPGGRLDAYFDLKGFPSEPNISCRAIHDRACGRQDAKNTPDRRSCGALPAGMRGSSGPSGPITLNYTFLSSHLTVTRKEI